MKERPPAFQFYPRQFAADDKVMIMDLDVLGAHILLMCAAAASPERYRISTDERAIRMLLRNPGEADWQRIKSQLLDGAWKLSEDGRWWEQHGLRRTIEKQKTFSEQQRQRAVTRYSRRPAEGLPETHPNSTETSPKSCSSSSSSSSNPNTGDTPAARKPTQPPKGTGFNSTEIAVAICTDQGWSGRLIREAFASAVEFQARRMPEMTMEQVGEQLLGAWLSYKKRFGNRAGDALKFFQLTYADEMKPAKPSTDVFANNPATRALAALGAEK